MLAQQLADRGAGTVTYLDMSAASLAIAQARAKARGLKNITFHQGSLLDLPGKGWQAFDYIDFIDVIDVIDVIDGIRRLLPTVK